jgi:hypothetical protein
MLRLGRRPPLASYFSGGAILHQENSPRLSLDAVRCDSSGMSELWLSNGRFNQPKAIFDRASERYGFLALPFSPAPGVPLP